MPIWIFKRHCMNMRCQERLTLSPDQCYTRKFADVSYTVARFKLWATACILIAKQGETCCSSISCLRVPWIERLSSPACQWSGVTCSVKLQVKKLGLVTDTSTIINQYTCSQHQSCFPDGCLSHLLCWFALNTADWHPAKIVNLDHVARPEPAQSMNNICWLE